MGYSPILDRAPEGRNEARLTPTLASPPRRVPCATTTFQQDAKWNLGVE